MVAEKLPAAIGGALLAAKRGRAAAAVCAKFWVARKGAGEGHGAEPRKLWPEPKGDPRGPHVASTTLGQWLLLLRTPSKAGLTRSHFNPSGLGGNNFVLSRRLDSGWLGNVEAPA